MSEYHNQTLKLETNHKSIKTRNTFNIALQESNEIVAEKKIGIVGEYLNSSAGLWWVNIDSEQVDFQHTCPDRQVEILEKYQNFSDLSLTLNFECGNFEFGKLILIRVS